MSATDNSRTKPAHNPHSCGGRLLDAARPWPPLRLVAHERIDWDAIRLVYVPE